MSCIGKDDGDSGSGSTGNGCVALATSPGTVLGGTTWAVLHEPKPGHLSVIEALLVAGADVSEILFPTGNVAVDELLQSYGAEKDWDFNWGSQLPPDSPDLEDPHGP